MMEVVVGRCSSSFEIFSFSPQKPWSVYEKRQAALSVERCTVRTNHDVMIMKYFHSSKSRLPLFFKWRRSRTFCVCMSYIHTDDKQPYTGTYIPTRRNCIINHLFAKGHSVTVSLRLADYLQYTRDGRGGAGQGYFRLEFGIPYAADLRMTIAVIYRKDPSDQRKKNTEARVLLSGSLLVGYKRQRKVFGFDLNSAQQSSSASFFFLPDFFLTTRTQVKSSFWFWNNHHTASNNEVHRRCRCCLRGHDLCSASSGSSSPSGWLSANFPRGNHEEVGKQPC